MSWPNLRFNPDICFERSIQTGHLPTKTQNRYCLSQLPCITICECNLAQGFKNPVWQVAVAIKFCPVVSNICGFSAWNLFHVPFLAPKILWWRLDFFFLRNLCTPDLVVMFFLEEKVFSCFCRSVTRASCSRVLISRWRNLPSDRQRDTTPALTYVIRNTLLFPCNYQTRRLFSLNTITQTVQFSLQVPAALVSLSLNCNVSQNSYLTCGTTVHQAVRDAHWGAP